MTEAALVLGLAVSLPLVAGRLLPGLRSRRKDLQRVVEYLQREMEARR